LARKDLVSSAFSMTSPMPTSEKPVNFTLLDAGPYVIDHLNRHAPFTFRHQLTSEFKVSECDE